MTKYEEKMAITKKLKENEFKYCPYCGKKIEEVI